jgi:hypothetical protein
MMAPMVPAIAKLEANYRATISIGIAAIIIGLVIRIVIIVTSSPVPVPALMTSVPTLSLAAVPAVDLLN